MDKDTRKIIALICLAAGSGVGFYIAVFFL